MLNGMLEELKYAVLRGFQVLTNPKMISSVMDAISDGWQYGRDTSNLMVEKWEMMLDQPLDGLRERFGIELSPLAASMSAAATAT